MTGEKRPRLESVESPPDELRVFTHGSISSELVRLVEREVGDDADVWSLVDEIRVRLNTFASELRKIDEDALDDVTDLDDLTDLTDLTGLDANIGRAVGMMPDPETLWHTVATVAKDTRRPRPSVDVAGALSRVRPLVFSQEFATRGKDARTSKPRDSTSDSSTTTTRSCSFV